MIFKALPRSFRTRHFNMFQCYVNRHTQNSRNSYHVQQSVREMLNSRINSQKIDLTDYLSVAITRRLHPLHYLSNRHRHFHRLSLYYSPAALRCQVPTVFKLTFWSTYLLIIDDKMLICKISFIPNFHSKVSGARMSF